MKTKEVKPLNSYSMMQDQEYTHYRLGITKFKKDHKIIRRPNYKKFVRELLTLMKEELLEREGGVCIKGFGYWFNWKPPKKIIGGYISKEGIVEMPSFETNMHLFLPTFWGADSQSLWSMDKTFTDGYKQELKNKIKSGKRYKMYISTLKQMRYI